MFSCIECIFFLCWPSPGTVTCLLLCLLVTVAFRDPFFSGLVAYLNRARYVIACFFCGTLVGSLLHSGFILALLFGIPWVSFLYLGLF